ncbi:MAG: hypothetical protein LBV71_14465 [Prevotella sp.]|nr:hypothetical protein [Prevotella sp.]MDR3059655.1 hypothetical protein [Prevotella sp.]
MKSSKPFTITYALVPSAMLLTSIGLLNFDSNKTLGYVCFAASVILLIISLAITIKQKIRSQDQRFT